MSPLSTILSEPILQKQKQEVRNYDACLSLIQLPSSELLVP